jgi:sugar phosphate permease
MPLAATRRRAPGISTAAVLRLVPLLGLLYLIAYLDRQNIGFAKLQMVADLGVSEAAYGLGASLFFIGYLLFEIPSNLILHKVGARRWFARIMLSWGAVTMARPSRMVRCCVSGLLTTSLRGREHQTVPMA